MSIFLTLWWPSFSDIFPLVAIILCYKQFDGILKILSVFLIISALSDFLLALVPVLQRHHANNSPIFHIYDLTCVVLFGIIYYRAFFSPSLKKTVLILSAFAFLIGVANTFFIENIWEFPSITNTALSLQAIIFSLLYFYQLLNRQEFIHIEKQSLFWINTAILFYYAVTIFFFMLLKKLSVEQNGQYYIINTVTNVICNSLFTVGLFFNRKTVE